MANEKAKKGFKLALQMNWDGTQPFLSQPKYLRYNYFLLVNREGFIGE